MGPAGMEKKLLPCTGVKHPTLSERLVAQLLGTLPPRDGLSKKESDWIVESTLAALADIKPVGGIEAMLAVQMVATHNAAMQCFAATKTSLPLHLSDFYRRHAEKLLALFIKQLETLNRNRGKGQQKVTVEHVHVQSGGQAIVGNIKQESK
jgi:hypothetical protein